MLPLVSDEVLAHVLTDVAAHRPPMTVAVLLLPRMERLSYREAAAAAGQDSDEGVLSGQCAACGTYLEQVDGADEALAPRSFDRAHPLAGNALHTAEVPVGWSWPLSGPGALSN